MEITWYGHSCFRISERGMGSVVCDPYDYQAIGYEPLKLKSDIVTISCNKPGHSFTAGIKGEPFIIDGPGEYEINNVFINGYKTNVGTTHILLIPVGGGNALNSSKAVELISMIKPNVVIPMHYAVPLTKPNLDPLSKFLKEMGITQTEDVYSSYKITNIAQLPEETKVIILNHPQRDEMGTIDESAADDSNASEPILNEESHAG